MTIKIEVTGNSLDEVADKLLAIGSSLRNTASYDADNAAREALQAERGAAKPKSARKGKAEEATPTAPEASGAGEAAPTGTPAAATSEATAAGTSASTAPAASEPPALDFDKDVTPAVLGAVEKHGRDKVSAILSEFGVARASQLDEALWVELLQKLSDIA